MEIEDRGYNTDFKRTGSCASEWPCHVINLYGRKFFSLAEMEIWVCCLSWTWAQARKMVTYEVV